MAETMQVFRCEVCGHVIQIMHGGAGTLVCCDQPMTLLTENTTDAAQEKHVPVVEREDGQIKVKDAVGYAAHLSKEAKEGKIANGDTKDLTRTNFFTLPDKIE